MKPKRSGIIRRFDMLGRIVVPKEIRQALRLKEGDPMEIGIRGESIVMERYQPLLYLEDTCEKHHDYRPVLKSASAWSSALAMPWRIAPACPV